MVLLRHLLGDALRRLRLRQGRTLREVSATARVSLGYLSEVERGRKEASSELLASICDALGAPLSQVLREVSDGFALAELQNEPAFDVPLEPALAASSSSVTPRSVTPKSVTPRLPQPAVGQRIVIPERKLVVGGDHRMAPAEPVLEPVTLPGPKPKFEKLSHEITDLTDMVPV